HIVDSLQNVVETIDFLPKLVAALAKFVQEIQTQLHLVVEPSVQSGMIMHLVFMIESYRIKEKTHQFKNLSDFQRRYRLEVDLVQTNLMVIEKEYEVQITVDDVAFITQAFLENKVETSKKLHTNN